MVKSGIFGRAEAAVRSFFMLALASVCRSAVITVKAQETE